MIFIGGCCLGNLSVKFLLWIVYMPSYRVDYFNKNSKRNISFEIQLLSSAVSWLGSTI